MRRTRGLLFIGACTLPLSCAAPDEAGTRASLNSADSQLGSVSAALSVTKAGGEPLELNSKNAQVVVQTRAPGSAWVAANRVQVNFRGPSRLDVMLVADNSGSQAEHLPLMQESIGSFAEKLMASGKSDRVGLVRVSTEAQLLLALSSETEKVRGAGSDMFITNGWTALWDGIRLANDSMFDETLIETKGKATQCVERTLRAIVAFTDGSDNNSADEQESRYSGDGIDTRFEELLKLNVGGTKTPVFTVGIGSEVDETSLTQLSEMSGGMYVGVEDMRKLHGALMSTAARLRTQVPVCFERAQCEHTEARVILTVTSDGATQVHTLPVALPPGDCRTQPPPKTEPKTQLPKPEKPKTQPPPKTKPAKNQSKKQK